MMEERMEKTPRRIFINNTDSYSSRCIAEALKCERPGAHAEPLQIVGTVSERSGEAERLALEEYFGMSRNELLPKLMECDVIIYNVSQDVDHVDEAFWAIRALQKDMENFSGPKMFLLISTVLTWACSKPAPEELMFPFTDRDFLRRRPHPNFKQHMDLERMVLKVGKADRTLLSTYVVASGLQYGKGEQVLHYFFKTAWLGQEQELPVFGDGGNIVPTIHITDLASVVLKIIKCQPDVCYLLAVDSSKNTMKDIVKAIATVLGPGRIKKKPLEEAFLKQDLSMMDIDSLTVHLRVNGVSIREQFPVHWHCDSGLVNNIERVVEEYRQSRGLQPVRVCVLGPPSVGKTTVAHMISELYKLRHVTQATLGEVINKPRDTEKKPESEESAAETQGQVHGIGSENGSPPRESFISGQLHANEVIPHEAPLPKTHSTLTVTSSGRHTTGTVGEHRLVKVLRDRLMSNPCRNQGYVLDGLPETYEQAKQLFGGKPDADSEDGPSQVYSSMKKILPEFVLCIEASDDFLQDRMISMPEGLGEQSNEFDHFKQRLTKYREDNKGAKAEDYFKEHDISPMSIEISSSNDPNSLLLIQMLSEAVGEPRNYGPNNQEVEEEERRRIEERVKFQSQQREQEAQREAEETKRRVLRWEEWVKGLEQAWQQEEELLEAQTAPMKNYLIEHVMPTLTNGLIECCLAQPPDPVDFLAEYLFKNNPYEAEVTSTTLSLISQALDSEQSQSSEGEKEDIKE